MVIILVVVVEVHGRYYMNNIIDELSMLGCVGSLACNTKCTYTIFLLGVFVFTLTRKLMKNI